MFVSNLWPVKICTIGLFMLIALTLTQKLCAQEITPSIRLNQLGFAPEANKIAVITQNAPSSAHFYVINEHNQDTVFRGELSQETQSAYSSTVTKLADFSSLQISGIYHLYVPGNSRSYSFRIDDNLFAQLSKSVIKAFYYQRSGMPIAEEYALQWHHKGGHMDTAVMVHPSAVSEGRPAGTVISSPRGWYDAGDYNKYVVNSGITVATLLSAYEDFSFYFDSLDLNIPESVNNIPDILDETQYNIRWMLTMQDPTDGGVYHKCTDAEFDGMIMPEMSKGNRYVVQKSTAATLDFAAVMAYAARIYRPFENELPGFADSCLFAAERAWEWAIENPALLYDQEKLNASYDPDILTGAYGDSDLWDEWFWAASELLISTGKETYLGEIEKGLKNPVHIPNWSNVAMLGYFAFLRNPDQPEVPQKIYAAVKDTVLTMADNLLAGGNQAFATVMGQSPKDFVWGSSSVAANQGILLIKAFQFSGNRKYLDGALTNLDYLLGRNATGYSFVTGFGSHYPMHPHHRLSEADGIQEPIPGFLVGGPNPGMQDNCNYEFTETETAYVDHVCSYASNEIAINWNAPMVYLTNAINALQQAGPLKK